MSTPAVTTAVTEVVSDHDYRVTLGRVVRSEWTKLRSLRSTWIVLGLTLLLTVALAAAFGRGYGSQIRTGEVEPSVAKAADTAFIGLDLFALIIGVLGTLQMSGEYSSGLIRASLTAVPRRLPLLWAKALTLVAVTLPVMGTACLASFLVCQAFIGEPGASLGDPGVFRAIIGAACYPVATSLIGLGVGALLRSTAVSITVFVVAFLIVPALLPAALSHSMQHRIIPYLPIAAAQATYALQPDSGPIRLLSPAAGAIVFAGWIVAVLAAGAVVLRRRDA